MSEAVLVTGGCGFIGSHIADRLIADGHAVVVVDDLSTGDKANLSDDAVFRQGSVADRAFLEGVFDEFTISAVIHEASRINTSVKTEQPTIDVSVTVSGIINLIDMSLKHGVGKFVFASSVAVYGTPAPLPVEESRPLTPNHSYGIAKQCAEQYVHYYAANRGLNANIARYANIYGPRQPIYGQFGIIAIFADKITKDEPLTLFGDGEHVRDYLYVDDAVEATVRLLEHPGTDTFNVASGEGTSVKQVLDTFEKLAGRSLEIVNEPERPSEFREFYTDIGKIDTALGWRPQVNLADGIERTLDYYRRQS